MTSHETVNIRYSELQAQLFTIFGAEGRGLSEMVRSIENQIPPTLSWEIRAVAHIRNKVVHEGLVEIPRYFEPLCKEALTTLKRLKAERKVTSKKSKPAPRTPLFSLPVTTKLIAPKPQAKPAAKKPIVKAAAKRSKAKAAPARKKVAS